MNFFTSAVLSIGTVILCILLVIGIFYYGFAMNWWTVGLLGVILAYVLYVVFEPPF